jgi:hypothetical protein
MRKLVLSLALVLVSVAAYAQTLYVDGAEVKERPDYINVRISKVPLGAKYFASIGYGQTITSTKPGAVHTPDGQLLKLESEVAFLNQFAALGYRLITTDRRNMSGTDVYELLMELRK